MLTKAQKDELVRQAVEVRNNAYCPYSHYAVGAALLTTDGRIYTGVNVENAVLPLTNCAEQTAIFRAVTDGVKSFAAIAVVTENAGMPCGACRQVMAEFNLEMIVLIADADGRVTRELTVAELLPGAFTPQDLI